MLATNFWNIGAAAIAALALQYAELAADPRTAVFYTFLTAAALAALVLVARLHIPESPRWPAARGRETEAKALVEKYGVDHPPREEVAERLLVTRRHIRRSLHRPAPHLQHSRLLPPLRPGPRLRR
jgi:77 Permeases of the major facilitator superfamily